VNVRLTLSGGGLAFCPTATAFSGDAHNCTHEFPKSGANGAS
jgi:hypothetical protein